MVIYKRTSKSEKCPKYNQVVEPDEELGHGIFYEAGKNVEREGRTFYSQVKGVVKQWHNFIYVVGFDDPPDFNITDSVIGTVGEWCDDQHEPGWLVDINSVLPCLMPTRQFCRILKSHDAKTWFKESPIILGEVTYRNPIHIQVECITPGLAHLKGTVLNLTNFEYMRACILEGTGKLSEMNKAPMLLAANHRLLNCDGILSEDTVREMLKEPAKFLR